MVGCLQNDAVLMVNCGKVVFKFFVYSWTVMGLSRIVRAALFFFELDRSLKSAAVMPIRCSAVSLYMTT